MLPGMSRGESWEGSGGLGPARFPGDPPSMLCSLSRSQGFSPPALSPSLFSQGHSFSFKQQQYPHGQSSLLLRFPLATLRCTLCGQDIFKREKL